MAVEVRVRRLTPPDVRWAIALTDTEGWGYSVADLERLLHLEPEGVFLAEAEGTRVGITATTTYGKLAYLGSVIVESAWRGKGVGDALMAESLAFLKDRGVESVRLNAYTNVVPFYERLGFRGEFQNLRFEGIAEGWTSPGIRLARADDLDALAGLDETYFGARRTKLLRRLLGEFPNTFLILDEQGEPVAYAVGNTSVSTCEIGPFVCPPERAAQAGALFRAMFAAVGGPCASSLPAANVPGVDFARRAGLRETFRTVRMVRGSDAYGGIPTGIFALAGLEKG